MPELQSFRPWICRIQSIVFATRAEQLFAIQDAVVAELKKHLLAVAAKVRR